MSPTRSTDTNLVWFSKNIRFPCSKPCKGAEPPSPNLVVVPIHFQCQVKLLKEKKVTWQIVVSLPASEPFLADMAEPRPSRRMGMATRSFMTVAFLVLVAFFTLAGSLFSPLHRNKINNNQQTHDTSPLPAFSLFGNPTTRLCCLLKQE